MKWSKTAAGLRIFTLVVIEGLFHIFYVALAGTLRSCKLREFRRRRFLHRIDASAFGGWLEIASEGESEVLYITYYVVQGARLKRDYRRPATSLSHTPTEQSHKPALYITCKSKCITVQVLLASRAS